MALLASALISTTASVGTTLASASRRLEHRASCDVIEVNSFVRNSSVFEQVIFWKRRPYSNDLRVSQWLYADRVRLSRTEAGWQAEYSEGAVSVRVYAPSLKRTTTDYDPEREDREVIPYELRHPLFSPGKARAIIEAIDPDNDHKKTKGE